MGMNDGKVEIGREEITLINNDLRYGTIKVPLCIDDKKGINRNLYEIQQGLLHGESKATTMTIKTGNTEFPEMIMMFLGIKADGVPLTVALNIALKPSLLSAKEPPQYSVAMSIDAVDTVMRVLNDDRIQYK